MALSTYLPTLIGFFALLATAFIFSTRKNRVDWGLILRALSLQLLLALLFTQVDEAQRWMQAFGAQIEKLQEFANIGGAFVFGGFISQPEALVNIFGEAGSFIFALKLIPVLVFVAALVSIAYYIGLLQAVVRVVAKLVNLVLGVSGAEAISNGASAFVGQVEAQMLIKPYLKRATESELLAMMAGSFACISGGMMAIYIGMGVPASYLLSASIMAIPGAFAIAKILVPETVKPVTQGSVRLEVEQKAVNLIDAAAQGAMEGWHIGVAVLAMLIAFISLVAFVDAGLGLFGSFLMDAGLPQQYLGFDLANLTLSGIFGQLFYFVALAMGIPAQDALTAGSLLGTKMMINEFVAYSRFVPLMENGSLQPITQAILAVALCGFANLGSIAIQLGGIGAMVPERRGDIARLGLKAMLAGTMASYLSATMIGGLFRLENDAAAPGWTVFALVAVAVLTLLLSRVLLPRPAYFNGLDEGATASSLPPLNPPAQAFGSAPEFTPNASTTNGARAEDVNHFQVQQQQSQVEARAQQTLPRVSPPPPIYQEAETDQREDSENA